MVNSMRKKTISAKAPEKTQEKVGIEDEKPFLKSKKPSNEIDEIFAGKKRKKPEGKKTEKSNKDESVEPKSMKKKNKEKKKSKGAAEGGFPGAPARPTKKTEDGLTIYTEEELGISNADAGNTPLCPFDCNCCF